MTDRLTDRIINGDLDAIEEAVCEYIPTAKTIAHFRARLYPEKAQDIYGVAFLALVEAIHMVSERGECDNLEKFVKSRVRWGIQRFLARDHLIRVPRDAWRKMMQSLDDLDDAERLRRGKELSTLFLAFQPEFLSQVVVDTRPKPLIYESASLNEILSLLALSPREATVIRLRMNGYTLQEIGEALSCTHANIIYILKKIGKRYILLQRTHPSLPEPPSCR